MIDVAAVTAYLDAQGVDVEGRLRLQGNSDTFPMPYPTYGNPMLTYLVDHAREEFLHGPDAGDLEVVLWWLAVTAWFEGAIDRTADIVAADGDPMTLTRRPSEAARGDVPQ